MDSLHASAVPEMFYDVASALPTGWNGPGLWGPQQVAMTVMNPLRPGPTQSYKICLPAVEQTNWWNIDAPAFVALLQHPTE